MSLQFYTPDSKKEIFATGDIHGWHKNLAKGSSSWLDKSGCRDFEDEFVMTETLIKNINDTVDENDILLHYGDWSFGGKQNVKKLRDRIKCKTIFTLLGNHCHHIRQDEELQKLFVRVMDYNEFSLFGFNFISCHYPIMSWNYMKHKTLCLHGHCHHNLKHNIPNLIDVGIDGPTYDFKPVHISTLMKMYTDKREKLDHHTS